MIQPLQMGMPGAPELVIMVLVMVLLVLPLLAVLAAGVLLWRRSGSDDERVEELSAEVERLQEEVAELEAEEGTFRDDREPESAAE